MKNLILLNPKTGGALKWSPPASFAFLQEVSLLPVHAAETGRVASALPLAIRKDPSQSSGWALMAVCGQEASLNVMVDGDGRWTAPATLDCLKYLPFALKELGGGKALAGIDPKYAGKLLVSDSDVEPLYGKDGQLHPLARARVDFLSQHQPRLRRTQDMLAMFDKEGLIAPWPEAALKAGGIALQRLHTIDEKRLSQLEDEVFLELRKAGALAVAYSCLLSLYQIRNLVSKSGEAKPVSDKAVQTTGDIDLEFLNDSDTIKFGPMH